MTDFLGSMDRPGQEAEPSTTLPEGSVASQVSMFLCGPSDQVCRTIRKCQNRFGQRLCVFGLLYYDPSGASARTILTPRGRPPGHVGQIVRP
jgi:hypothetical protein